MKDKSFLQGPIGRWEGGKEPTEAEMMVLGRHVLLTEWYLDVPVWAVLQCSFAMLTHSNKKLLSASAGDGNPTCACLRIIRGWRVCIYKKKTKPQLIQRCRFPYSSQYFQTRPYNWTYLKSMKRKNQDSSVLHLYQFYKTLTDLERCDSIHRR